MTKSKKYYGFLWGFILLFALIFLDQYTKNLVLMHLKGKEPIYIIKGALQLSFVGNKGIAWSMLWEKVDFVVILTTIISILILFVIFKIGLRINFYHNNLTSDVKSKIMNLKLFQITLIVMLSGAVGNLIDRIRLEYVVDFIDFNLINFPVFNVADIYIVLSMIVFIILYFFKLNEEEIFILFKSRKKWTNYDSK